MALSCILGSRTIGCGFSGASGTTELMTAVGAPNGRQRTVTGSESVGEDAGFQGQATYPG